MDISIFFNRDSAYVIFKIKEMRFPSVLFLRRGTLLFLFAFLIFIILPARLVAFQRSDATKVKEIVIYSLELFERYNSIGSPRDSFVLIQIYIQIKRSQSFILRNLLKIKTFESSKNTLQSARLLNIGKRITLEILRVFSFQLRFYSNQASMGRFHKYEFADRLIKRCETINDLEIQFFAAYDNLFNLKK